MDDPIRKYADGFFSRTLMTSNLVQPWYNDFFCTSNFNTLVATIQSTYNVSLTKHYFNDVLDSMLNCYKDWRPLDQRDITAEWYNQIVVYNIAPKMSMIAKEQERYRRDLIDIQNTRFIHPIPNPENICKRKESLSFSNALFGPNDSKAAEFAMFKTGL